MDVHSHSGSASIKEEGTGREDDKGENPVHLEGTQTDFTGGTKVNVPSISADNYRYESEEVEPELHWHTWVAFGALLLLNFVIVIGLNGTGSVVGDSQIKAWPFLVLNLRSAGVHRSRSQQQYRQSVDRHGNVFNASDRRPCSRE